MLAGLIVVGLGLVGCGDDDDGGVDAGRDAGARDAAMVSDGAMDGATGDAATDGATADGASSDAAADAATGAFTSTLALNTAEEVPPCAAAGESAMGTGTVEIDAEDSTIEVSITFSGLSGPATAGHIHIGAPGVAGPPILPFTDLTSPIEETFEAEDYPATPPAGAPADFEAFVAAVRAGETYVNIHTEDCAPGEIRDQITD